MIFLSILWVMFLTLLTIIGAIIFIPIAIALFVAASPIILVVLIIKKLILKE